MKKKPGFVTHPGFFENEGRPALNKFPTYWNSLYLGTGTDTLDSLSAVGAADLTWRELL
jgi:hypothetical protein